MLSDEPPEQPTEAAPVGRCAVQARRHEGVDSEATAGVGEEEDDRPHGQHEVGPSPLVRHAEDADRDVGSHANGDQGAEPREQPENQCDGDERLRDEGHPAEERPVRDRHVDEEVAVGADGRVLNLLLDPVPQAAPRLAAEVVGRDLPGGLLPPKVAIDYPREPERPQRGDGAQPTAGAGYSLLIKRGTIYSNALRSTRWSHGTHLRCVPPSSTP